MKARRRSVYLNKNERALRPNWEKSDTLMKFLGEPGVRWRADPVFHSVIVDDPKVARRLKKEFGCVDISTTVRAFLSRRQGVRIVGCDAFSGMLVYSAPNDVLYHVDTRTWAPTPMPDISLAYAFYGLGRAAHDAPLEYTSISEAVRAFKPEAHKAKKEWLRRHGAELGIGP